MKQSFEKLYNNLVQRTEKTEKAIIEISKIDPKETINQELLTQLLIECKQVKDSVKKVKEKIKILLEQNKIEEKLLLLCKKIIEKAAILEMKENELIKMAEKLIQQPQLH